MNPSRTLLCATDLSGTALQAVERAYQIASATSANLHILHCVELSLLDQLRTLAGLDVSAVQQHLLHTAHAQLQTHAVHEAHRHGVDAQLHVHDASVTSGILEYASRLAADLLIIGAHGQGFLQRNVIGATASRLLRRRHGPTLIVKTPCRGNYQRALVAIDFSPASQQLLTQIRQLAPHADLLLMHVFEVPFESKLQHAGVEEGTLALYRAEGAARARRHLQALADACCLPADSYTLIVRHGDARNQLLNVEEQQGCDLVALGKHGMHLGEELLLGSVTKHLISEARSDVLVVVDRAPGPGDGETQDENGAN